MSLGGGDNEGIVTLFVTSRTNPSGVEKRFPLSLPIHDLKAKLELIIGASSQTMKLSLKNKEGNQVAVDLKDDSLLGDHPVGNGYLLFVEDVNMFEEDLSKVQKFELSEEQYEEREDSVKAFLMRNKMGKYAEDPEEVEKRKQEVLESEKELAKNLMVKSRCRVRAPKQATRFGTIMFIGEVHFKPGWWVGIKYDEPLGKNDGSVGGKRYFECDSPYGSFVKPQYVEAGDFPEEALMDDDEEEI